MTEPFDILVWDEFYSIFPEEEDTFAVFKNGVEYIKIQKDDEEHWLKLHQETELPLFEENKEVEEIGKQINLHLANS